jgi:hypothetical protein
MNTQRNGRGPGPGPSLVEQLADAVMDLAAEEITVVELEESKSKELNAATGGETPKLSDYGENETKMWYATKFPAMKTSWSSGKEYYMDFATHVKNIRGAENVRALVAMSTLQLRTELNQRFSSYHRSDGSKVDAYNGVRLAGGTR